MLHAFEWLRSTDGFVPRRECGDWSDGLLWLHAGSDVFIWLAYTAIPITLLVFVRRRGLPFGGLFWLFAAFILACGSTHLVEALMFDRPLYRLSGVLKAATAAVSWGTVVALLPAAPRIIRAIDSFEGRGPSAPEPPAPAQENRWVPYVAAVLGALAIFFARLALAPAMGDAHPFVLAMLAVVAASWYGGLGPGLLALAVSAVTANLWLIRPNAAAGAEIAHALGTGLFVFSGVGCALLGERQRTARRESERNYARSLANQWELQAEVARREQAEGAITRYARDLATAQEQTVAALAQLDTFVMNAPLGMALFDADGRFVRVNRHLSDAAGGPAEGKPGESGEGKLTGMPPVLGEWVREVAATGEPVTGRQVQVDHPAVYGGERTWQASVYPVRCQAGILRGVGLVARDVTFELRAETELREGEARYREMAQELARANAEMQREVEVRHKAEAALLEADRRKDEFLSMLAHELRNPLAPIRNAVEILRVGAKRPGASEHAQQVLTRQVKQMVRLIDDLLDVSRITRGKLKLVVEEVELRQVVEAAVEMSRPLLDKARVAFHAELPDDALRLRGDRVRLAQVLSNLLNNAAKYTEPGGTVTLSAGQSASHAFVRVRDTGVGIAPEYLPRVWELFTQVDRSLNRAQGGLGIGLALVRNLVEMHGGRVSASSGGVGHGAEFAVEVPLAGPAAPADAGTSVGVSGTGDALGNGVPTPRPAAGSATGHLSQENKP